MSTDKVINEFTVTGRIIKKKEKENGDVRITVASRNGKDDIFPHILCPKGLLPKCDNRVHVKISGHITASTAVWGNEQKLQYTQTLIADNITVDQTISEEKFGVRGRFYPRPAFELCLKGTVHSAREENGWMRYQVELPSRGDNKTLIRLSMNKLERQPDLKKGDEIYAVCGLTTPKKIINGKSVTFEDLIVIDMASAG